MKSETKSFLKDAFGSLINNNSAITAAKTSPWWLVIILFFLAIIMPIVPITVNAANTKGSSAISKYAYNLDKTVPYLTYQMAKEGKTLTVNDNHELDIIDNDSSASYRYENALTGRIELEIYFSIATSEKAKTAFITSTCENKLTLTPADASAGKEATYYTPSYIIFFKNGPYMKLYKTDSTTALATTGYGDYAKFDVGTDLVKLLYQVNEGETAPKTDTEILTKMGNTEYTKGVFKNFKSFLDKSNDNLRVRTTWISSGIYLGVYAALSLIMSFLIWLLTRGKNNPFNYLKLLTCFKIGTWASVCPGLIGLVIGFLVPKYAVMVFIMTMGLRIMWLSMKQLRPQQ